VNKLNSRKSKQAAQNAVQDPTKVKRENIPLKLSQQIAMASVRERQAQLEIEGTALLGEILAEHNLDPKQLGKEYLIKSDAIVFEVK
jgi:hypothetical protein